MGKYKGGRKKGSPKALKPKVREYIVERSRACNTPRDFLARELITEIESIGEIAPTEDTLLSYISTARNQEESPLDVKWDIGSLKNYELNPDVVPILFQEQTRRLKENQPPITILQALWASRLYSTIRALLATKPQAIAESIIYWSGEYAIKEKISNYAKTQFDTTELDEYLLSKPDMTLETWLNKKRSNPDKPYLDETDLEDSFFPPSHFSDVNDNLFPVTPDINFQKRDRIRKQIQKQREDELKKDGETK